MTSPSGSLPHLYRLSANPEPFVNADTAAALSVLHAALCFRRLEKAGFLGIPWIVARRKKNGDSNSRS